MILHLPSVSRAPSKARKLAGCAALASMALIGNGASAEVSVYAGGAVPLHTPAAIEARLDLGTRLDGTGFAAARARLDEIYTSAPANLRSSAALDYASFLISWMMLPEAASFIEAAQRDSAANGRTDPRAEAYLGMIRLLADAAPPPNGSPVPEAVRNDPVWSVIADIQSGEEVSKTRIRTAAAGLTDHSRFVSGRLAPHLFKAAMDASDWDLARKILNAAQSGTDLEGTSQMLLMRGQLARAEGQQQMAFDFFAWAAEHQDRAAAEARIELAELALQNSERSVHERVRDLLAEGLPKWRGDSLALKMRAQLARVSEDLGDAETAVMTMALIEADHPGTPEAELAERRIKVILSHLGDAIALEAMGISEAVATVRRIEPYMAAHTERAAVRGALAHRLEAAGLTVAARAEFTDIWDSLLASERDQIAPDLFDRLVLEQAKQLVRQGTPGAALDLLRLRPDRRVASLDADYAKVVLEAGGVPDARGESAELISLEIARSALREGRDAMALAAMKSAGRLPAPEGIAATRLAAEQGQTAAEEYLERVPSPKRGHVEQLAGMRAADPPPITPLSTGTAQHILRSAATSIDAATALTAQN